MADKNTNKSAEGADPKPFAFQSTGFSVGEGPAGSSEGAITLNQVNTF
jgi:hypothetical protein